MFRLFKALFLAGFALSLLAVFAATATLLYFGRDLPRVADALELQLHSPLRVLARDGALIGEFGLERREPLAWEDVPQALVNAFLAAEDDRFFSHPGVDYQGLLRAAWVLVTTGEKAQGGSTITMQLARNLFLTSEKSYTRKIREIMLAFKLEQALSKEEILRLYLNKIFLGQRAYGVAAAARIYYGRSVDELSLDQVAMLAGLPKAPSSFNPIANPQRARIRRDYVLGRMRDLDMISAEEEAAARDVPVIAALAPSAVIDAAPFVAEMVRQEMYARYGEAIYTSGVEVRTTIDSELQAAATRAVVTGVLDYDARHGWRGPARASVGAEPELLQDMQTWTERERATQAEEWLDGLSPVASLQPAVVLARTAESVRVLRRDGALHDLPLADMPWPAAQKVPVGSAVYLRPADAEPFWTLAQVPQAQAALVAMDPLDGSIRALVGGTDFSLSKFNRAVQARRQPGSSFKPFLYSAALDSGLTAATVFNDAPVVFDDPALGGAWRPENYDGRFRGPTRVREALVRSSNLVTIRMLERVGIGRFREYAARFGFEPQHLPRDLSIALGSGTFTPMEIASGFAVIANGGWKVESRLMERVQTQGGEFLEEVPYLRVCPECAQDDAVVPATPNAADTAQDAPLPPAYAAAPRQVEAANMHIIADMLRDAISRGTGTRARTLGRRDIAGKTGTTNEQRDAWFAGFHPQLVAVTWIGHDDLTPLGRGETGARAALPIWIDFMRVALEALPEVDPVPPEGVVTARIDPDSGLLSSQGIFEMFLAGNLPPAAQTESVPGTGQAAETTDTESKSVLEDLF